MTEPASTFVLGWKVDAAGMPQAWLKGGWPNMPPDSSDLVMVEARLMLHHTAVVAQSGSGKSFFVGRLIEELVTRSKANVLVLDPNGDFRNVSHLVPETKWVQVAFAPATGKNWLPTERQRAEFEQIWKGISLRIESSYRIRLDDQVCPPHYIEPLRIPWMDVPPQYICGEFGDGADGQVELCHQYAEYVRGFVGSGLSDVDLFILIEKLMNAQRSQETEARLETAIKTSDDRTVRHPAEMASQLHRIRAMIGEDRLRQYFAAAEGLIRSDTFCMQLTRPAIEPRLRVLDLASLPSQPHRLAMVSAALRCAWREVHKKWQRAVDRSGTHEKDDRVPTFLVVDEAHHFVPKDPIDALHARVLRQFKEIATEGRKFGLFLVLITQRPDRLDPVVAGECSNVGVMHLNSGQAIRATREVFSLEDECYTALDQARQLGVGRLLLLGAWCQYKPCITYVAARRTQEGGVNLRTEAWARKE